MKLFCKRPYLICNFRVCICKLRLKFLGVIKFFNVCCTTARGLLTCPGCTALCLSVCLCRWVCLTCPCCGGRIRLSTASRCGALSYFTRWHLSVSSFWAFCPPLALHPE